MRQLIVVRTQRWWLFHRLWMLLGATAEYTLWLVSTTEGTWGKDYYSCTSTYVCPLQSCFHPFDETETCFCENMSGHRNHIVADLWLNFVGYHCFHCYATFEVKTLLDFRESNSGTLYGILVWVSLLASNHRRCVIRVTIFNCGTQPKNLMTFLKQYCFNFLLKFQFSRRFNWNEKMCLALKRSEDNLTPKNRKSKHVVFQGDNKLTY